MALKVAESANHFRNGPHVLINHLRGILNDRISFQEYKKHDLSLIESKYDSSKPQSIFFKYTAENFEYLKRLSCGEFDQLKVLIPRCQEMITNEKLEKTVANMAKHASIDYFKHIISKMEHEILIHKQLID